MTEETPIAAGPTIKRPGSAMMRTPRQFRKRSSDRRAEAPDVEDLLVVRDRKSATDVERIENAQAFATRRGEKPCARANCLDVLGRIGSLRADVKRQAAHLDSQIRG